MSDSSSPRGRSPLLGQVGLLLRNALNQWDVVRDAAVQTAQAGKLQLDVGLLRRRRQTILARLGEQVLTLFEQGTLDERELPELSDNLAALRALDEELSAQSVQAQTAASGLTQVLAGAAAGVSALRHLADQGATTSQDDGAWPEDDGAGDGWSENDLAGPEPTALPLDPGAPVPASTAARPAGAPGQPPTQPERPSGAPRKSAP